MAVEEEYRNIRFEKITLTTFGFQAQDFYKKLGIRCNLSVKTRIPNYQSIYAADGRSPFIWCMPIGKAANTRNIWQNMG